MFLRSSGGGFFSTCGFAAVSVEVFVAAGLCAAAGGGVCSVGGLAGARGVPSRTNAVAFWHFSCMFYRMIALRFRPLFVAGVLSMAFACAALGKHTAQKSAPPKKVPEKSAPANTDWQVIKVNSRDYLSADNIGKFYGLLGNLDSTGKTIVLNNGRNQL